MMQLIILAFGAVLSVVAGSVIVKQQPVPLTMERFNATMPVEGLK